VASSVQPHVVKKKHHVGAFTFIIFNLYDNHNITFGNFAEGLSDL
jgi:hypothetical protein